MQSGGAGQPTARWWAFEQAVRAAGPLLWFAIAAAVVGYCGMPFSDHPDTLRDLLAARDCVERGDCAAEGATTSFANLHNGALWPFLLAFLRAAHLPSPTIWWLVLGVDALSIALVYAAVDDSAKAARPVGASSPAVGHVAALAGVAVLVAERTPNTVWSPALSPWFACLLAAWWLRWRRNPPRSPWGPLVFGSLLGLLADSHPATWPCAAAWLAVLAVVAQRPMAALAWTAAGLVATTGLLAPQTQLRNLQVLLSGTSAPIVAVAAASVFVAGRVWLPTSWRNHPAFGPLAASLSATSIVLAGTVAFGHSLEVRYLTPSLLIGIVGVAGVPWPVGHHRLPVAVVAVVVALAGAARLGPGSVSMGHSWAVITQVGRALRSAGVHYPASASHIQGFGCKRIAAAVEVDADPNPWMVTAPSRTGVQILDLPSTITPPSGWQLLERRVATSTWWRMQQLWLQTGEGRACLVRGTSQLCATVQPGLWLGPDGAPAVRPGAPWHVRAMPESIALPTSATEAASVVIDIPIRSQPGSSRAVALLDSASAACPWSVVRTDHPGAQLALDRRSIVLPGVAAATTLTVAKSFNGRCSTLAAWGANAPCLLEIAAPLPPLAAP